MASSSSSSPSSLLLPLGSSSGKTTLFTKRHGIVNVFDKVQGLMNISVQCSNLEPRSRGSRAREKKVDASLIKRRDCVIRLVFGVSTLCNIGSFDNVAKGAGLPPEDKPRLCDETCEKELKNVPMVTTESGLQFKDIKVGQGPSPPVGFQVAANYVAMVPSGQIFDSSLEKGQIYIFRVGSGQVIKGLDEGILSMKVGGKRRLYIPGPLAFPRGLTSAPGRPRVAPNSPVVFDVSLEYIPGLEVEEE
ncbi:PREDICTED: peptidyl-prolyl cis-trans isomerase FKBP16-3, chloroplastic-like [Populus euphratica]|uniref:peptidylprolyl isomerase n=1 Tax=Populus euphratica TaxID=75702 RepID=A0AAJ6Y611_POPEU|nr:PREDICTED: peptidyl-prolyl cis-trans isomerase FKBP16-3, chloroplastic-like [Populus euphratica]